MLITIFLTSILIEALNKQVKAVVVFNDVRRYIVRINYLKCGVSDAISICAILW